MQYLLWQIDEFMGVNFTILRDHLVLGNSRYSNSDLSILTFKQLIDTVQPAHL